MPAAAQATYPCTTSRFPPQASTLCSFLCLVYSSSRYTCGYVNFFKSLLRGFLPRRPALPTLAKTEGPPRSCTSKNKLPNACARLWIEGNRTTFLSQLSYSRSYHNFPIHAICKLLAFDLVQFHSLSPPGEKSAQTIHRNKTTMLKRKSFFYWNRNKLLL